jgi:hypothetical protein
MFSRALNCDIFFPISNLDWNSMSFWYFWCVLSVSNCSKHGHRPTDFIKKFYKQIFIRTSQEIKYLIHRHPLQKIPFKIFNPKNKSSPKNLISVSEWFHSLTFFLPRFHEFLTIWKFSGLQEKLQCMMEKHKSFQK